MKKHPIDKKHLHRIYGSFWVFLLAFSLQLIIVKRYKLRLNRRFGAAAFLGHIDSNRPFLTAAGFLVNLGCLVAVLDFLFRGHLLQSDQVSFSRVGYVDSSTARIVVRAPISDYLEITVTPISDAEEDVYQSGIVHLNAHSDFVGTFLIEGLNHNTSYKYSTNASHVGSFRTSVEPKSELKRWSLVSSSCIKPFYPYNPLDHGLRIKGLEHLSNYVSDKPIDMVLFLGDFIYIDLAGMLKLTQQHTVRYMPLPHGRPNYA